MALCPRFWSGDGLRFVNGARWGMVCTGLFYSIATIILLELGGQSEVNRTSFNNKLHKPTGRSISTDYLLSTATAGMLKSGWQAALPSHRVAFCHSDERYLHEWSTSVVLTRAEGGLV